MYSTAKWIASMALFAFAEARVKDKDLKIKDKTRPELRFHADGTFKIMQMSGLYFGETVKTD